MEIYLGKTKKVRNNETQLQISYQKPYKRVSRNILSWWIKCIMKNAGIDTNKFKSHSTRPAAASAANQAGIPIPLSEVEKKTGAEFVAYGTMGLNLGHGKKIT